MKGHGGLWDCSATAPVVLAVAGGIDEDGEPVGAVCPAINVNCNGVAGSGVDVPAEVVIGFCLDVIVGVIGGVRPGDAHAIPK